MRKNNCATIARPFLRFEIFNQLKFKGKMEAASRFELDAA
jgi:hypothetical protein